MEVPHAVAESPCKNLQESFKISRAKACAFPDMSDDRSIYEFGPFRLDVAEQQLLRDGRVLPLTPKVFDVLRVLVQNSGRLVEKERLLADVWPGSFVEEGALSRSVSILRKTLGDNGSKEYIETVPKRGYRFVATVTQCSPDAGEAPGRSHTSMWIAGAVAVALIALLAAAPLLRRATGATPAATRSAPAHRQLTFTGIERSPTISPDGRRIAYVSVDKPDKRLIVQELAGGPPLTIFTAPEINYLRWSPDGSELIVWARGSGKNGVYVMPQLGGTPRQIATAQFIGSWSPDGSTIALAGYDGQMRFVDSSGRPQRTVPLREAKWSIWDIDWSARGIVTFVSSDFQGHYTIWTMKPDGSEQRRIVESDSEIPTARWDRHGGAIYYLRRVNQTFSLFKVPFAATTDTQDQTPSMIMAGLESDRFFALSGDRRRLVYARAPYYSNLWLVRAGGQSGTTETRELTHGTSLVERPSVSPDGTSIVFNVGHESSTNVHTMPIGGGPSKQLTSLDALSLGAVWSRDGRQIAFASTKGGRPRVWLVDADGGVPQAVSSDDFSDTFNLTWSPGSRVLYQQAGNRNYHVLDPRARQERLLLGQKAVGWIFSPVHSPDGRRIAAMWNRPPVRGIWILDAADARGAPVYPTKANVAAPIGWAADARSIYVVEGKNLNFRGLTAPGGETMTEARILEVPVDGGPVKTVLTLPFEEIGGISMTPDGRAFVCAVYSSRSDIWVVDDFDPAP
jgi:Tol biopolymer transport system component/DNA-binding winged helix-turn-helix (wHTH) protein